VVEMLKSLLVEHVLEIFMY